MMWLTGQEMIANRLRLGAEFFDNDVEYVAQALIGADLYTNVAGARVGGKIIATESYGHDDPFSHCYGGPGSTIKPGAEQMCGPPGRIYFAENNLGCTFNISCGPVGRGSAVLICALQPFCGSTAVMRSRRKRPIGYDQDLKGYRKELDDDDRFISFLCDGPQNLCDSLGITDELYELSHSGKLDITDSHFELLARDTVYPVEAKPRRGLDKQLEGFKLERAAHPEIEQHRLALRRFVMKDCNKLPSCLPDEG